MSDLRARLAEALRKHRQGPGPSCRCCGVDYDAPTYTDHLADALLSLPGIAIVELPEPSYVEEPELAVKGYGFNGGSADADIASERGVYAHGGLVYDQWNGVTPTQARMVASWWLAAANAAESVTK